MNSWTQLLQSWKTKYGCRILKPVKSEILESLDSKIHLPIKLKEFYREANGLVFEWFRVLPIEDISNTKHTWNGITRANDPLRTNCLSQSPELLRRFLVFADLGHGDCAVFDKSEGSIWYEENGELHQTDLGLEDFIEASLKEVKEL